MVRSTRKSIAAKLLPVVSASAILAGMIAAVQAAQPASKASPLRVDMNAVAGGVEIAITNTSGHTVRMPKWQLPSDELETRLFDVSLDGKDVRYTGRLTKFAVPTAKDFFVLKAGATIRKVVDLSNSYDMSKSGEYTITFSAPLAWASLSNGERLDDADGLPLLARSRPVQVWLQGKGPSKKDLGTAQTLTSTVSNGVTYVGCSSSQISTAAAAVTSARGYSENAKNYLNTGTVGPRYTTWFGSYTSGRYATVKQHFANIDAAMDQNNGEIAINCSCTTSSYAHVYSSEPYQIFVCNAFWNTTNTGTDSRAGTLIHEMSHFNVVADTDDIAYGQYDAKKLATRSPSKAVWNADSHEYFAENNPAQN